MFVCVCTGSRAGDLPQVCAVFWTQQQVAYARFGRSMRCSCASTTARERIQPRSRVVAGDVGLQTLPPQALSGLSLLSPYLVSGRRGILTSVATTCPGGCDGYRGPCHRSPHLLLLLLLLRPLLLLQHVGNTAVSRPQHQHRRQQVQLRP